MRLSGKGRGSPRGGVGPRKRAALQRPFPRSPERCKDNQTGSSWRGQRGRPAGLTGQALRQSPVQLLRCHLQTRSGLHPQREGCPARPAPDHAGHRQVCGPGSLGDGTEQACAGEPREPRRRTRCRQDLGTRSPLTLQAGVPTSIKWEGSHKEEKALGV